MSDFPRERALYALQPYQLEAVARARRWLRMGPRAPKPPHRPQPKPVSRESYRVRYSSRPCEERPSLLSCPAWVPGMGGDDVPDTERLPS